MSIDRYARPQMASVWTEESRLERWLRIEVLACEAWAAVGAIPAEDLPAIRAARFDVARMHELEATLGHDLIAFLTTVSESIDTPARRHVHRGLTSSDVVDTGLATQLVESVDLLAEGVRALRAAVLEQAVTHRSTLMAGRTHGMVAEPTTFGLKLLSWVAELDRCAARLAAAREEIAVGTLSGAVGTHATLPREVEERVLAALGLNPDPAPTQVVARDRHANFMSALALTAGAVERFALEVRHLQRSEVGEVLEPFGEGQKGSSAMPHKRNPVLCERLCGLARVVRADSLVALENAALWHERDISHSSTERLIFPEACSLTDYMLWQMEVIVRNWEVHPDRMRANLDQGGGLVFSQRVLLALTEHGMSREDAYQVVQSAARTAWAGERGFREAVRGDARVQALLPATELEALFDADYFLRGVGLSFDRMGAELATVEKAG
ncbi:MAG: adenylosuccinate lyase [Candidatus Dormibacteria bacterium]